LLGPAEDGDIGMNLQQFRVMSVVLRLPEFTAADLVREAGVSSEVVRKVFQRYNSEFSVVRVESSGEEGRKRKVRTLLPAARERLRAELSRDRLLITPPTPSRGPLGEPMALIEAERIFYEALPLADGEERGSLLRQTRSQITIAGQQLRLLKEEVVTGAVEGRRKELERMLKLVDVLHLASSRVANQAGKLDALVSMILNARVAQEKVRKLEPGEANVRYLEELRLHAPEEAKKVAQALLALGEEPAWRKSLKIGSGLWTAEEKKLLERALYNSRPFSTPQIFSEIPTSPEIPNNDILKIKRNFEQRSYDLIKHAVSDIVKALTGPRPRSSSVLSLSRLNALPTNFLLRERLGYSAS
jgi:hypothetical protein